MCIRDRAYGDQVYYGRLEVVVSGQAVEPPDGEDIPCDCTGYTLSLIHI